MRADSYLHLLAGGKVWGAGEGKKKEMWPRAVRGKPKKGGRRGGEGRTRSLTVRRGPEEVKGGEKEGEEHRRCSPLLTRGKTQRREEGEKRDLEPFFLP